jgi:hypothetical protein
MPLANPRLRRTLFLGLLALVGTQVHAAEGFQVRDFTCPVGGARFTQDVGYMSLVLVQFPDGSWLGDDKVDAQIPECPGNGLVLIPDYAHEPADGSFVYLDYTPAQLAKVTELVASGEYRALLGKGRHERALFLADKLGLPAGTRWELLRRSTWAAVVPAERRRLVERFAAGAPALIEAMGASEDMRRLQRLALANALRELGRFDEAEAILVDIVHSLPADADATDPEYARDLQSAVGRMMEAIEYRDDDRFPVDMAFEKWRNGVCGGGALPPPYGPRTKNAEAACARHAQRREAMEEEFEQSRKLQQDPEALASACAKTPAEKRDPGLANACREVEWESDEKAGKELARNEPRKVAAECEATPEAELEGPMRSACSTFQTILESELETLVVEDDDAYAIVCQDGRSPPDRAGYADLACSSAERERSDREAKRLLADPVALDAKCKSKDGDRSHGLGQACMERGAALDKLEVDRLAGDPKAYTAACAAYEGKEPDPYDGEFDKQEYLCGQVRDRRDRAEIERLSTDPAAYAAACAAMEAEEEIADYAAYKRNRPCLEAKSRRAMAAAKSEDADDDALADDAPAARFAVDEGIFGDDSGLRQAARDFARRIVAKAKADRTYPKRRAGDMY